MLQGVILLRLQDVGAQVHGQGTNQQRPLLFLLHHHLLLVHTLIAAIEAVVEQGLREVATIWRSPHHTIIILSTIDVHLLFDLVTAPNRVKPIVAIEHGTD